MFFALCLSLPTNAQAQAQEGDILLRGGYLWQRIQLKTGYGEFLNERYGVKELNPAGLFYGAGYMFGAWGGLGYEQSEIADEFAYKTLNGVKSTGKITISQQMLTLHILFSENIGSVFGWGTNELTRDIAGYKDVSIVTGNVSGNGGATEVKTKGDVMMAELSYKFLKSSFTPEIGLRYTSSIHTISASDKRPAIDNRGNVAKSEFDLSGIALTFNLSFIL